MLRQRALEAEVRERLVGLSHAVNFVTLLHGTATAFGGFHQFVGQTQGHRLFTTLLGGLFHPAHGQSQATDRAHLNRHLVVGTANAAGLHFDHGLHVVDGHGEGFQRVFARVLLLDLVEGTVNDALGNRFFAALHDPMYSALI
eukprot:Opistho-2@91350